MSIGLALSGGGAKGIAHIGVIKALIDNGINIDYISGTSSGSIIASLFASGYSPNEILSIIINNKKNIVDLNKKNFNFLKIIIKKEVNINGFVKGNNLENIVRKYLVYKNVIDINDIKIPIAITTVSLNDGRTIYFSNRKVREGLNELNINKGEVASIVRASLSVPGVFIPKKIEEKYYIDGGVNVNTPVNILKKMGADKIIAVSFEEKHRKKGYAREIMEKLPEILTTEVFSKKSSEVPIVLFFLGIPDKLPDGKENISQEDFTKFLNSLSCYNEIESDIYKHVYYF